ncbi:MAG: HAD-IIB family hydrolase [Labilithrix sp.]|nr:HAD-IIB family hydrolase [Labilithrix sp.]MCW5817738.1 HAD-IIB family hydrolase [Labilithrix sp.]
MAGKGKRKSGAGRASALARTAVAAAAASTPPRRRKSGTVAKPRRRDGFKLLALDLDGTLLDHAGAANDVDVAAVRKLHARGIKVTILTGRLYSGTRESAELLHIDGPVGCADGSHIVNVKNDKTLLHHGIRGRAAARLRSSLEENELVAFLFAEEAIVHDERGADFLPYIRTWSTDLRYARRVTDHGLWESDGGMTAVVALGSEAKIQRTVADIQREARQSMQVATFPFRQSSDHWGMVARASGGTKGTALEWVSEHYGVAMEDTVCVGDWLNDLPMMSCAGRSFAMGQAPAEVKAAATDVLEGTIHAGGAIAEAIERAFGL